MAGKQTVRQDARRKVQQTMAARQQERIARERRLAESAIEVLASLAERDQWVTELEVQAAAAIQAMTDEGLSLAEVGEYCGDEVDAKELARLVKLAPAAREG